LDKRSLFSRKNGKKQSQQQAEKNASGERKVESEIVSLDMDVAGKPPEFPEREVGNER